MKEMYGGDMYGRKCMEEICMEENVWRYVWRICMEICMEIHMEGNPKKRRYVWSFPGGTSGKESACP